MTAETMTRNERDDAAAMGLLEEMCRVTHRDLAIVRQQEMSNPDNRWAMRDWLMDEEIATGRTVREVILNGALVLLEQSPVIR